MTCRTQRKDKGQCMCAHAHAYMQRKCTQPLHIDRDLLSYNWYLKQGIVRQKIQARVFILVHCVLPCSAVSALR